MQVCTRHTFAVHCLSLSLPSRFIINIPAEQREDLVRLLFAVELAHWFFIDFYCEDDTDLHKCHIKDFAQQSKSARLSAGRSSRSRRL